MIGFCLLTILLGVLVLDANSDVAVIVSLFVITTLFSLLVGYICVVQPVVVLTMSNYRAFFVWVLVLG